MQLLFKVILLFLIIFNFRIPVVYNSVFLSIIISTIYYLFVNRSIPFTYFFRRYNVTIFFGLLIILFVTFSITIFHQQFDFVLVKSFILQLFILLSATYILPILIEGNEKNAFDKVSYIILLTFGLQGIIQLCGFIFPPFGDFLLSLKSERFQQILNTYGLYFRGYSLCGSPFFELPAGYGLSFMLFFRLIAKEDQNFITGIKGYILFFLFLLGGIFSGRTAFVGLVLSLLLYVLIVKNFIGVLLKGLQHGLVFLTLIFLIYMFLLPSNLKYKLTEDVFPFAFEFFYEYEETGKFSTDSSDVMIYQHYFPLSEETLLKGDGRFENEDGSYYMYTDAGYMRSVLYGGILYALFLIIYQSLYFVKPLSISYAANTKKDKADFLFLMFLFLHLFFLEYKALTIGTQHIMQALLLTIGSSYMIEYYARKETNENIDY